MVPFNIALHEHLTGLGFRHRRVEEQTIERGDAESGPLGLDVYSAYDSYIDEEWFFMYCEDGRSDQDLRGPQDDE